VFNDHNYRLGLCRYCFYKAVQNGFWATRCPDKREIWHGDPLPVPNFTFIGAEMWEYSLHGMVVIVGRAPAVDEKV